MHDQDQSADFWNVERVLATGLSSILAIYLIVFPLACASANWYMTTISIFSLFMIAIGLYPVLSVAFKPFPETSARSISLLGFLIFFVLAVVETSLYLSALDSLTFGHIIVALKWLITVVGMCGVSFYFTVLGKKFLDSPAGTPAATTEGGAAIMGSSSLHP